MSTAVWTNRLELNSAAINPLNAAAASASREPIRGALEAFIASATRKFGEKDRNILGYPLLRLKQFEENIRILRLQP